MSDSFKYVRMQSSSSICQILESNDEQRLEHLVEMFDKYHMTGKRYEAKSWHHYFRRVAVDPVIFYQYNAPLFYEDCQYDFERFQVNEPTIIHGDLHIGNFLYHLNDFSSEPIFILRKHKRIIAPFTWDLKRLATNLALIAYQHAFSDIEMIEVLTAFTREYIQRVTDMKTVALSRQKSVECEQNRLVKRPKLQKQNSVVGTLPAPREKMTIQWRNYDNVAKMIVLAEQLALVVADCHCHPPIALSSCPLKFCEEKEKVQRCLSIIQSALSSETAQEEIIREIQSFAMTYIEIALRDHKLFFKHFRSLHIFQHGLLHQRISHPLADARRVPILIVGGGIGGMALALCFAKAGIRTRLLERNVEFGEVGAGMQLAPNCSRLLDQLGVLKSVQTNAVFPKQIVWMDAQTGEHLTSIDLGEKFLETFQYPYIVVHRADLFFALHQACLASSMVTMETNRLVTSVDERPKSIMVQCADGMRYDCDFVVAADGLWSSLRKFVHDDGPPLSVGYVTYRGTIPITQVSKEGGLENVQFWIGHDLHLVQYPIRRGELFNQAAVFRSKQQPNETDQWGTKEELNEKFSNACAHVQQSLQSIQTNFRWPVYDRNPLEKWSRGRLVLLGDAAHPMLQYAAQGAAQAIEDAFSLVAAYQKNGPNKIELVIRQYEQERIPRSTQVMEFARTIGNFAHQSGWLKEQRDAMLRQRDIFNYEIVQWLYEDQNKSN